MSDELLVLDPPPETLTLSDGTVVKLLDLKARQFFKLLRILTHGPAVSLMSNSENLLSGSSEAIVGRLMGFLLVSIPDAYDETIAFLSDMVQPDGLRPGKDKPTQAFNLGKWQKLQNALENPELEDVLDLVSAIIKRESGDLAALGKKVASLFKVAEKTGQLPTSPTSQAPSTSEDSAEPSTSSVPSTDGQTSESETSLSVESDNAPQPLPNEGS